MSSEKNQITQKISELAQPFFSKLTPEQILSFLSLLNLKPEETHLLTSSLECLNKFAKISVENKKNKETKQTKQNVTDKPETRKIDTKLSNCKLNECGDGNYGINVRNGNNETNYGINVSLTFNQCYFPICLDASKNVSTAPRVPTECGYPFIHDNMAKNVSAPPIVPTEWCCPFANDMTNDYLFPQPKITTKEPSAQKNFVDELSSIYDKAREYQKQTQTCTRENEPRTRENEPYTHQKIENNHFCNDLNSNDQKCPTEKEVVEKLMNSLSTIKKVVVRDCPEKTSTQVCSEKVPTKEESQVTLPNDNIVVDSIYDDNSAL